MPDELDFSLPDEERGAPKTDRRTRLIWLVLALQVVLVGLIVWSSRVQVGAGVRTVDQDLGVDAQRALALKLEKQGLADEAAQAWQDYLRVKQADAAKRAEIWYRIANIHRDAGQYSQALAAYYRSESTETLPHLENEIGRRVQECLEAMGKFAALRYELAERTTVGAPPRTGEDVLAEIGPTAVTQSDLDRIIEDMLAQQLARYRQVMTPEQLNQRKEEMLRQFADNRARKQLLSQYVTEEVLYRRAREEGLADDPAVRQTIQQAERSILASQALEREVADNVTITSTDVKTFYEANPDLFREPEKARVAHILLPVRDRAEAAIASIGEGQDFRELAEQLSTDEATAAAGGVVDETLTSGRNHLPGIGPVSGLSAAVFAVEAGAVLSTPLQSERGWHVIKVLEKIPSRQIPFEQARERAYRELRSRKEQEVQQAFVNQLFDTYDVVIHEDKLGGTPASPNEGAGRGGRRSPPGGTP